ncbi:hypothetical protein EVU91_13040 [Macrococcoides bohemicum]|uniref:hypothetical protein n=1 Tax=Macrococcoides bohemicum TaxID=1903056 RepID=UPI001059A0EE|nr:hypothetical protein [Macrococcus bohemicus]TDL33501.1 hypothetical protein EVU91_13040 [Macrococcus bohemicus]
MEKQDAVRIVKRVNELYPKSPLTKEMALIWVDTLLNCDFELSNQRLTDFYRMSRYNPKIQDIAVKEPINYALLQHEEIQKCIEVNKHEDRAEREKQINKLLKSLEEFT